MAIQKSITYNILCNFIIISILCPSNTLNMIILLFTAICSSFRGHMHSLPMIITTHLFPHNLGCMTSGFSVHAFKQDDMGDLAKP